jgi:hypothetical protein
MTEHTISTGADAIGGDGEFPPFDEPELIRDDGRRAVSDDERSPVYVPVDHDRIARAVR